MKNKDRRYRYRRGRDTLRFTVVENADRRQTGSSMSNKSSEVSKENHTVP